jgi:hypothetical protein
VQIAGALSAPANSKIQFAGAHFFCKLQVHIQHLQKVHLQSEHLQMWWPGISHASSFVVADFLLLSH